MSWKIEDVERFKKGLNDDNKKEWLKIANRVLKSEIKKGTEELEAEIIAIRTANKSFSEYTGKVVELSEYNKAIESMAFGEITADEYQLVLPIGTYYDDWYGEIIVTKTYVDKLVKNQTVLKTVKPSLNENHDRGRAVGWASELQASEEGLLVKWDFNKVGKQLLEDDIYRYYSAELDGRQDIETGDYVYPIFSGAALTNHPVMKTLPQAHLKEHSEGIATPKKINKDHKMDFNEIKGYNFSEAEKVELADRFGFSEKIKTIEAEKETLSEKIIALGEVAESKDKLITELQSFKDESVKSEINTVVEKALSEGRIAPVDKDKWIGRLEKDFKEFSEMLNEIKENSAVDMTTHGSDENGETALSDKEKLASKLLPKTSAWFKSREAK